MKYVVNLIVTSLCLIFLGAVFSNAKASNLQDQIITYGTCQAIFEQSEGDFTTELHELDKSIQALARSYGFGEGGETLPAHEEVVANVREVLDEHIAKVKADVLLGWIDVDVESISNALLGCRIQFANLSTP